MRVIEITDGAYLSGEAHEQVQVRDGIVCPRPEDGINHVAVLERLDGSGEFGVGLVRGFGLERGAIASASNPLTQAVVAVGADLESLAVAIAAVVESEGAFVAVDGGRVVAEFPTPLFGQTGSLGWAQARERITALVAAWRDLGCRLEYPFAYLEFVAATSEPYLRVSTRGVVRAEPSGSPRGSRWFPWSWVNRYDVARSRGRAGCRRSGAPPARRRSGDGSSRSRPESPGGGRVAGPPGSSRCGVSARLTRWPPTRSAGSPSTSARSRSATP